MEITCCGRQSRQRVETGEVPQIQFDLGAAPRDYRSEVALLPLLLTEENR